MVNDSGSAEGSMYKAIDNTFNSSGGPQNHNDCNNDIVSEFDPM